MSILGTILGVEILPLTINAFLRGILQKEVYIGQPLGFVVSQKSTYICKLHKSFYGLKQASRVWNERFTSFLSSLGFLSFYANSSLFEKYVWQFVLIIDIILTGSAIVAVTEVISALTKESDIKDLEPLYYFLRILITQNSDDLFLSQAKYVSKLLVKTEMKLSNPCATPCLPYNRLLNDDGKPFNN